MVSVMLYSCIVCVAMLKDMFVFWLRVLNGLVKQFAICLGVVVILLLIVMEVFNVGGGALLDRQCMVFQKCACYACDPSLHLSAPSIGIVYV